MQIYLSPQVNPGGSLSVSKAGDVLTIDGVAYDFSALASGATLPMAAVGCDALADDVERDGDGDLIVTLILPIGMTATEAERFPDAIIDPEDGPIELPGASA